MKRALSILLATLIAISMFSIFSATSLAADDPLIFDSDAAFTGEYTIAGNAVVPGSITFKTYQVTYVGNPFTDEFPNAPNYHKMNIKVPVSYNGIAFDEASLTNAPILFYNPWGGDNGATAPDVATINNNMKRQALAEGWVVAEPGMRGINTVSGEIGTPEYYNYGKLPNPIVDLKAALRYLRYDDNAYVIPGNKELIFAMGSSSGGCGSSMLGATGNTHLYDAELAAIGAAPGRDDVFAAAPSCPIINRDWSDSLAVWMRWAAGLPEGSHERNIALAAEFPPHQESLGITATINGISGTPLTADNMPDYLLAVLKSSLIKHLNSMGGKAAIDAYLLTSRPADSLFGTPAVARDWIKAVYSAENPDIVVDIDNSWTDFMAYMDPRVLTVPVNTLGPSTDNAFAYDALEPNGVINVNISPYVSATTRSMGMPNDYGAVFSEFGIRYIEENYGIEVSDEYKELLAFQRNSVDPLYFILGDEPCDVTQNWWIRSGSVDPAALYVNTFNLAAALEMQGKNVDAALVWDQGHGLSTDVAGFFEFANEALAQVAESDGIKLSTAAHLVKNGDYFTVNAAFDEPVNSNTATLTYTFDGGLFEYANYTVAKGVSVINREYGEGFAKITVMVPDYNTQDYGDIMIRAKEDAKLSMSREKIALSAEYILRGEDGGKTLNTASGSVSFTTLGTGTGGPAVPGDTNGDGSVNLLDLSDLIDWFGFDSTDPQWDTRYIFFDFDNSGTIDITDIAYVARLIK